jgi:hypothetical protein
MEARIAMVVDRHAEAIAFVTAWGGPVAAAVTPTIIAVRVRARVLSHGGSRIAVRVVSHGAGRESANGEDQDRSKGDLFQHVHSPLMVSAARCAPTSAKITLIRPAQQ